MYQLYTLHKHYISRFCTPISPRIFDIYSATTRTGGLKRRLSNHNVFWLKKKKKETVFYANGPTTFKVQLYKVQPFEITWPLSKQPFHEHASSRIVKLIFIMNNDYVICLRTSWVSVCTDVKSRLGQTSIQTTLASFTFTVKLRFTDTRLIRTPNYYRQFALSLGKESSYIFTKFILLNTNTPLIRTPSRAPSVECP